MWHSLTSISFPNSSAFRSLNLWKVIFNNTIGGVMEIASQIALVLLMDRAWCGRKRLLIGKLIDITMHDNNEFSTRIHCWCDLHGMRSDVLPRYKCCHDQWMGPFKRIRYFIKINDLRSSSFKQWKWVILDWVFLKSLRCYTIKIIILHIGFPVIGLNWRLREFFGRKSTFFLIYVSKDSPCSCDHFHTKLLVVGWHLRRRNPKKHPKKRNQCHLFCGVINDVSLMSHISSESPWSEVWHSRQTKFGDHVVAL